MKWEGHSLSSRIRLDAGHIVDKRFVLNDRRRQNVNSRQSGGSKALGHLDEAALNSRLGEVLSVVSAQQPCLVRSPADFRQRCAL